jgi:hypothetical protein
MNNPKFLNINPWMNGENIAGALPLRQNRDK